MKGWSNKLHSLCIEPKRLILPPPGGDIDVYGVCSHNKPQALCRREWNEIVLKLVIKVIVLVIVFFLLVVIVLVIIVLVDDRRYGPPDSDPRRRYKRCAPTWTVMSSEGRPPASAGS